LLAKLWVGHYAARCRVRWLCAVLRSWVGKVFAAIVLGLSGLPAYALPQLVLDPLLASHSQAQTHTTVDLRSHWQATVMAQGEQANTKALAPEAVWNWPESRFVPANNPKAISLHRDERYVARLELVSPGQGVGLNLSFAMPRIDAVHVAYRYADEPWVQASAGDTLAMQSWPIADRQPSFDIPQRPGKLSLVVEIAHQGMVDAPMVLQNAHAYGQQRMNASVVTGLLIGINLVLMAVGLLAALNFQRGSFISISAMTLLMAAVVAANSGVAGVYFFTASAKFNDQFKFLTLSLWCVLFPWVTATALSQRLYARWWWRFAVAWAVVGTLLALWWMQYPLRGWAVIGIQGAALASTVLALAILLNARADGHVPVLAATLGVVLYGLSLTTPVLAYYGFWSSDDGRLYACIATLVAALLFMYALVRQHRQGHMVMSRAKTSPRRDMLTGLLNRAGFNQSLVENVKRMKEDDLTAAFFYLRVSDIQGLKERYGDEGFEVGMVQLAATLASSIPGADQVGRIATNAFAFTVMMPRDEQRATHIAQKVLGRSMALASHGAPLAQTARIAVAWMPTFGTALSDLERRARRTLRHLENGKRIAWIGGVHAQSDSSYAPSSFRSVSNPSSDTNSLRDEHADTLPGVGATISRLEKDMLGPDSKVLRLPVKPRRAGFPVGVP
jgi:two-component system, sensor histidine kinase LadS